MSAALKLEDQEQAPVWAGVSAVEAMLKHESVVCLKRDLSSDSIAINAPQRSGPIYGNRLGVILLAGPEIVVTLKAFFNLKDVLEIIERKIGRSVATESSVLLDDYVKEFLNRVAGVGKRHLCDSGISVGISLPIVTRGFDEAFNKESKGNLQTLSVWSAGQGKASLILTAASAVKNGEVVGRFTFAPVETEAEDDMEFL